RARPALRSTVSRLPLQTGHARRRGARRGTQRDRRGPPGLAARRRRAAPLRASVTRVRARAGRSRGAAHHRVDHVAARGSGGTSDEWWVARSEERRGGKVWGRGGGGAGEWTDRRKVE